MWTKVMLFVLMKLRSEIKNQLFLQNQAKRKQALLESNLDRVTLDG
jgi:hypothetical protein